MAYVSTSLLIIERSQDSNSNPHDGTEPFVTKIPRTLTSSICHMHQAPRHMYDLQAYIYMYVNNMEKGKCGKRMKEKLRLQGKGK